MKPIDLAFLKNLCPAVTINGQLFDSKEPVVLSEDLLEISLPSGRTIDVGWYPEHELNGSYRVTLYRGHTGYPLRQFRTTAISDVLASVRNWIVEDSSGITAVSSSNRAQVVIGRVKKTKNKKLGRRKFQHA